jgi:putative sporulation protein YtxC
MKAVGHDQEAAAHKQVITNRLAEILAGHIMEIKEPLIVRGLISKEYKYESEQEILQIEGYCKQFLYGEMESEETYTNQVESGTYRRKHVLEQQLLQLFKEKSEIILEGFLTFRSHDYMEELREVVEYAIDEYMMDRQYQEFISLLQYFVYIQEAKIPAAHLIHKGGHEFLILDDQLKPIDASEFDATFKLEILEKDINFEDMIVSTLITVSPASIYIHTREPDMTIIKTIMQIFEDRTALCAYCHTCHTYLGDGKKQDQRYP